MRCRRFAWVLLGTTILTTRSSAAQTAPDGKAWTARGDAALASDPARALADYEHASKLAFAPSDLPSKLREAARRWLAADVARFRQTAPADPRPTLGYAREVHEAAKKYGVTDSVEPLIREMEADAAARYWEAQKREIDGADKTELEKIVQLEAVRDVLPATTTTVRDAASAEIDSRRAVIVSRYEQHLLAAAGHPGAQVLRARLVEAAKAAPRSPSWPVIPSELGRNVRVGWQAEFTGCDGLARAVQGARLSTDGAHRGSLRIDAQCSANETKRSVQRTGKEITKKTEYYSVNETRCESNYENTLVCDLRDKNGNCISHSQGGKRTQTCHDVPVMKQRTVNVSTPFTYTVHERVLSAKISGKVIVVVDGQERSFPLEKSTSLTEAESLRDRERFSSKRPSDVLDGLLSGPTASEIRQLAEQAQRTITLAHVASAESKLASGQGLEAEDELAAAVVGGSARAEDVPPAFASVASPLGLTHSAWAAIAVGTRVPSAAKIEIRPLDGSAKPITSSPDPDGMKLESDAAAAVREERFVDGVLDDANETKTGLILGGNHWDKLDGEAGVGLGAGLSLRGGGGRRLPFWFYDALTSLEVNSADIGFGLDALLRAGVGARVDRVWLAPYLVGGASGRGSEAGSSLYVPLGVDAGFGARAAVRLFSDHYLELFAERVSRPLRESGSAPTPILQRIHYEVRYVTRGYKDEHGFTGSCSFHQDSATDIVAPTSSVRARNCDLSLFFSF